MTDYRTFLARKSQQNAFAGFEPVWLPDCLFPFQHALTEWAVRKGRAAVFADCGLGKTLIQLVWAENVVRHTAGRVLILTPLAVADQTVREGTKFGVEAARSKDGRFAPAARIIVTNYERLHHFDPADFTGVVCDESSVLKNFNGKRKAAVTEFLRERPYRLLCTATAAPNDYPELGTSSEALGHLGYQDMLTRFFKKCLAARGSVGWGQVDKHVLRTHAVTPFWRWVCSWARACRKPSDLGFDDGPFLLPPLNVEQHTVRSATKRPGELFEVPAYTNAEQLEERRRTLPERCDRVAELVAGTGRPAVCWCHLNPEGDRLAKVIPDVVQVSGSDDDEVKEERFLAFQAGQIRVLVTKGKIGAYGLNWQHCSHEVFFPSHSFEQYYQAVRRCWRFGQTRPVKADVVITEGESGVLANLQRKERQAEAMFSRLVALMNDALTVETKDPYVRTPEVIPWL